MNTHKSHSENPADPGHDAARLADAPTPRVSVLMPVFNAAMYLREAVDSIANQTFCDFELIAIDDGSTDDSLKVLRSIAQHESRLHILSRANTGIVGALNDGLAAARGPLVARMDADDTCDATRFAKQIAYLDTHADCIAVGTGCTRTDPTGSPAGEQTPPTKHEAIDAALLRADGGALIHATLMMRTDALRDIGGWRPGYDWVEDLDLFLRLTERGRVANLREPLYAYRRHVESVCFRNYELMCERLKAVMLEAYARRGLPMPDVDAMRPELAPKQSAAKHYRVWACHAIHQNKPTLARRHAWRAVRHEPIHPRSWRVLYWAMTA